MPVEISQSHCLAFLGAPKMLKATWLAENRLCWIFNPFAPVNKHYPHCGTNAFLIVLQIFIKHADEPLKTRGHVRANPACPQTSSSLSAPPSKIKPYTTRKPVVLLLHHGGTNCSKANLCKILSSFHAFFFFLLISTLSLPDLSLISGHL